MPRYGRLFALGLALAPLGSFAQAQARLFEAEQVRPVTETIAGTATAVGDFDSDGDVDLLIARGSDPCTQLLRGDGQGNWSLGPTTPPSNLTVAVLETELNGDNLLDAVVLCVNPSQLRVLKGVGGGDFAVSLISLAIGSPDNLALADVSGDQELDLVVGSSAGPLSVLIGDGQGGFGGEAMYTSQFGGRVVALADFDGDLDIDLAHGETGVSIRLNDGTGVFGPPSVVPNAFGPLTAIQVADLDGDGDQDLVVGRTNSGVFYVLTNQGAANFDSQPHPYGLTSVIDLVIDDFGGSSAPDIAIVGTPWVGPTNLEVLLQTTPGTYTPSGHFLSGSFPSHIRSVDVNSDQHADLIVSLMNPAAATVLIGDGAGSFANPGTIAVGGAPADLKLADLNADGIQDVVVAAKTSNNGTRGLRASLGLGGGTFGPPQVYAFGFAPERVALGDLNSDSALDAVVSDPTLPCVWILLGDGAGGFLVPKPLRMGRTPMTITLADLDGDGNLDLATPCNTAHEIRVRFGNGSGGFSSVLLLPAGSGTPFPSDLAAGDLDGDGNLDLVCARQGDADLGVLFGTGGGAFAPLIEFSLGPTTFAQGRIVCTDLDGNGDDDVVLADLNDGVGVLLSSGGILGPVTRYAAGGNPRGLAVGDLDGDGLDDIALTTAVWGSFDVLRGQGAGLFANAEHYTLGTQQSWGLAIGDVDGDGENDVIATSLNWGLALFLLNR